MSDNKSAILRDYYASCPISKASQVRKSSAIDRRRQKLDDSKAKAQVRKRGDTCEWCGCRPTATNPLEVHHILPLQAGGSRDEYIHSPENMALVCHRCHSNDGHGQRVVA
jgi:5-methylcytosine-specific restriction endonuclease McrA